MIEMTQKSVLTRVFSRLRPGLLAVAKGITHSDEDAEDVVQEAFYRLWSRKLEIDSESGASRLTVTAVRNAAIDIYRQRRKRVDTVDIEQVMDKGCVSSDDAYGDEVYAEVKGLIDRHLPERMQAILRMRDYQGMEMSEIAKEMNMSEANVRMVLSRARRTVRNLYRDKI